MICIGERRGLHIVVEFWTAQAQRICSSLFQCGRWLFRFQKEASVELLTGHMVEQPNSGNTLEVCL